MNKINSYLDYKKEIDIVKNIEGLLVPGQEKALMVIASKLPDKATVVEIGSFKGKSTACIGLTSPKSTKIYAVDTFKGNGKDFSEGVQFTGETFINEFKLNLKKAGVLSKVKPLVGLSHDIGKKWNKPIDFLFIDGSHLYEDVKNDFEIFYPWIKEGGIIALHDVSPGHPGVLKYWNEKIKKELGNFENVHTLFFGIKNKNWNNKVIKNKLKEIKSESTIKKVFAILPVFNRLKFTKKCLDSFSSQTYQNIEVVVIDDGSTDGTRKFIKNNYPDVKIIKGNGKWFWAKSINTGIDYAIKNIVSEDFILTMNNDCFFDKNYIKNIVQSSISNYTAITGSYIVDAENHKKVIDAGVIINWKQAHIYGLSDKIGETTSFYKDNKTIVGIDTLPGKGTLIPIEVFNRIGKFNHILLPHYISDFEFFCRAKQKGYGLIVSRNSKLYNFSKETGSEHGNFYHKAKYMDVFKVLFDKKSKVNIMDHFFFLILCCPKKYILINFKLWFFKLLNYILLLFPFYYIKIFMHLYRKRMYITKLFIYRFKIKIRQKIFNK